MKFSEKDSQFMIRAIELAKKGDSRAQPNPLVGAVIVKDNKIIGQGYHKIAGENHAEINALEDCYKNGFSPKGATMYVTLEPCSHYGKTPPCANRILEEGIKYVFIGSLDPNPRVAGRGLKVLEAGGVKVEVGLLEEEAKDINKIFFHYIKNKTPYVIMKSATSLDGKIQTKTGESQWISSAESREYSHCLRSKVKAIGVGLGTVLNDNPSLTARSKYQENVNPIPVIFDSTLKIPIESKLLANPRREEVVILTTRKADTAKKNMLSNYNAKIIQVRDKNNRIDIEDALKALGNLGIASILIEGGGNLNFSFIEENLINEYLFFIAPLIIGGEGAKTAVEGLGFSHIEDALSIKFTGIERIGDDYLIKGKNIPDT